MVTIKTIISFLFFVFTMVTRAQHMTDEQIDGYNYMTSMLFKKYEPNETFIPMEHSTTTMPPPTVVPSLLQIGAPKINEKDTQHSLPYTEVLKTTTSTPQPTLTVFSFDNGAPNIKKKKSQTIFPTTRVLDTTTMPPVEITTTMPPVKTTNTTKRSYNGPTRKNEASSKYLETSKDRNTSKQNETDDDAPNITMTSDDNTPHVRTLDENITSNLNTTIIDEDTSTEHETILSYPYLDDSERELWEEIIMLANEFNITLCPDMETFYLSFKNIIGAIKGTWDLDSHIDEIILKVSKSSHPLAKCMMKFYVELGNVLLKTIEKRRLIKVDKIHEAKKGKEAAVNAPTVHVIGEKSFATGLKENLKRIQEKF